MYTPYRRFFHRDREQIRHSSSVGLFRYVSGRLVYHYMEKKAIISPGESFREIHGHFEKPMSWYYYFTVSEIDYGGYLSITVFDANHNSVTWWKVEDYSDVLVRYDLKREDMERLHWRISYPPTEAMKDVHMFPPYETFETNRADVMK